MNDNIFVGLDVHKATFRLWWPKGCAVAKFVTWGSSPIALAEKLATGGRRVSFCYEARPLRLWPASATDGIGAGLLSWWRPR